MRNLQAILMSGLMAAILSTGVVPRAAMAQARIEATKDETGRTIYVDSDGGGSNSGGRWSGGAGARSGLVYWSSTEHRFKPVPTSGAIMRAARSAASEVHTYLDGKSQSKQELAKAGEQRSGRLNMGFSEQEIDAAIEEAAARHNVDPNLVRSVIKVESNFNPNAVSRKGAMGLMQLMPATARSLNVSNPFDPQQNVDAGVRHLKKLLDNYGGDVRLSLAAYNAGAGAVARSAGVPRFAETRNYVQRITNLYSSGDVHSSFSPVHDPVRVERDERGVLHISNTE